jgi:hypothetical protein
MSRILEQIRENRRKQIEEANKRLQQARNQMIQHNTDYLKKWIERNQKQIIKDALNDQEARDGYKYRKRYRLRWYDDRYYQDYLTSKIRSRGYYPSLPKYEDDRDHQFDEQVIDDYLKEIFGGSTRFDSSFFRVNRTTYYNNMFAGSGKVVGYYDYFEISMQI